MEFFCVKDRKMIDVPDEQVQAVKYERTTQSGKKLVRYALKTTYQGSTIIKFVDEATYQRYASRQADVSGDVSSDRTQTSPSDQLFLKRLREIRKGRPRLPTGTPGHRLAELAGSITDSDAEEMLRAIEEDCERIDESHW